MDGRLEVCWRCCGWGPTSSEASGAVVNALPVGPVTHIPGDGMTGGWAVALAVIGLPFYANHVGELQPSCVLDLVFLQCH